MGVTVDDSGSWYRYWYTNGFRRSCHGTTCYMNVYNMYRSCVKSESGKVTIPNTDSETRLLVSTKIATIEATCYYQVDLRHKINERYHPFQYSC